MGAGPAESVGSSWQKWWQRPKVMTSSPMDFRSQWIDPRLLKEVCKVPPAPSSSQPLASSPLCSHSQRLRPPKCHSAPSSASDAGPRKGSPFGDDALAWLDRPRPPPPPPTAPRPPPPRPPPFPRPSLLLPPMPRPATPRPAVVRAAGTEPRPATASLPRSQRRQAEYASRAARNQTGFRTEDATASCIERTRFRQLDPSRPPARPPWGGGAARGVRGDAAAEVPRPATPSTGRLCPPPTNCSSAHNLHVVA